MLKELFDAMAEQSVKANTIQIIDTKEVGRMVFACNGVMQSADLAPPKRNFTLHSLGSLIELAKKPLDGKWTNRAIFYSRAEVKLVLDHGTGYESATLPLPRTKELAFFVAREESPDIKVNQLVLAGQTTLRACRSESEMATFVAGVGKLASITANRTEVQAARGLDKLSRTVTDQVEGLEHLPPELQTFDVRPFAVCDMAMREPLTCVLLPRTSEQTWFLQPLPESMRQFEAAAVEYLATQLSDAGVPLFCGKWS